MAKLDTLPTIEALAASAAEGASCELVEVRLQPQGRNKRLIVTIDRSEGVNVDDCARVSRLLGEALDSADLIAERYDLEVSSPGLTRPLREARDYQRYSGRWAVLELRKPIAGKRRLRGHLAGLETDDVVVIDDPRVGATQVPLELITHGHLDLEPTDKRRRQAT